MILDTEQVVPRIISLNGSDGSVFWMRWYNGGIDEHWGDKMITTRDTYHIYTVKNKVFIVHKSVLTDTICTPSL